MIPHKSLDDVMPIRASDVPTLGDGWNAISRFALAYRDYAEGDSRRVVRLANGHAQQFTLTGELSDDLSIDDLRACLFFELRRAYHPTDVAEGANARYVGALLDAVRDKL